jgi:hypothetical protein
MNVPLKRVLFAREAPYMIVLLVGLAAWILMRINERLTQAPVLEYCASRVEWSQADKSNPMILPPGKPVTDVIYKEVVRVTNISHSTRISKLMFFLILPPSAPAGSAIRFAWSTYNPPAMPRTQAADQKDRSEAGANQDTWSWYPVQELQPGWSIDLICFHTGDVKPQIFFNTVSGDAAVRLVEQGLETGLAHHETCVLLWLLGGTLLLIIAYLFFIGFVTPLPAS